MNYETLYNSIQSYAETTEQLFVANIPVFIQEAETRIYNMVQIPALRKNVTGNATTANPYLSLPDDYLSTYSIAIIDASNNYSYLLNKDVNFLRAAYSNPNDTGIPKYYTLFGPEVLNQAATNELSFMLAPTIGRAHV